MDTTKPALTMCVAVKKRLSIYQYDGADWTEIRELPLTDQAKTVRVSAPVPHLGVLAVLQSVLRVCSSCPFPRRIVGRVSVCVCQTVFAYV